MLPLFRKILRILPDKIYLQIVFFKHFHRFINFRNPKTFNEKLQWLKLYNRKPEYTMMVDKYLVKDYVASKIGKECIIPTLGVWNHADEIDFSKLPNQFVLKWNHDSGSIVICKDKNHFDIQEAIRKLKIGDGRNGYWYGREWPYKNVSPKIIAEKYLDDEGHVPIDYKVYCFNGEPYKVMLCLDRDKEEVTKFYSFDFKWSLLRHNIRGKNAPESFTLPKPKSLDEMYETAKKLSQGIPFVRVDFYDLNGHMFFGEITLYPDSGFDSAILPEVDKLYGSMINLNVAKNGEE